MASRQGELPPTIRVECPNCGFFNPVALRFAEVTLRTMREYVRASWQALGFAEKRCFLRSLCRKTSRG